MLPSPPKHTQPPPSNWLPGNTCLGWTQDRIQPPGERVGRRSGKGSLGLPAREGTLASSQARRLQPNRASPSPLPLPPSPLPWPQGVMGEEERAAGQVGGLSDLGLTPSPLPCRVWGNQARNPSLPGPWALPRLPSLLFALHALRGWLLSINSPSLVPVLRCS